MTQYIIHREDENYLEHFGVKGMRWGVRRYQNPDGSYKSGAEGRYDSESSGKIRKNEKGSYKEAERKAAEKKANKKKTESELEDEEISRRADALQKKNPKMSRIDAESAAEDEMVKEASEERKKQGKYGLLDRWADKIGESADRKAAERQKKKQNAVDEDDKWTQDDLDKYFGPGYFDTPFDKIFKKKK